MNPLGFEPKLAYELLSFLRVRVDADPGDMSVTGLQGIAPTGQKPWIGELQNALGAKGFFHGTTDSD